MRSSRWSPNNLRLTEILDQTLRSGLTIVANPSRLLDKPDFASYVENASAMDESPVIETLNIGQAVLTDSTFQEVIEDMQRLLSLSFERAETYSHTFDIYLAKYVDNQMFLKSCSVEAFALRTRDDLERIASLLGGFTEQISDFKKVKLTADLGILRINTNDLNAILQPSPAECIRQLHLVLPQAYATSCDELLAGKFSYLQGFEAVLTDSPTLCRLDTTSGQRVYRTSERGPARNAPERPEASLCRRSRAE